MARSSLDSVVATGKGDDGTTGLLYGGDRIRKDDLRTEAYGTIDEAVAALGLARAELSVKRQYGTLPGGLVDRAVGLGPGVVLRDPRSTEEEPGRAVVSTSRGDRR